MLALPYMRCSSSKYSHLVFKVSLRVWRDGARDQGLRFRVQDGGFKACIGSI